jgi:hypothetical protein
VSVFRVRCAPLFAVTGRSHSLQYMTPRICEAIACQRTARTADRRDPGAARGSSSRIKCRASAPAAARVAHALFVRAYLGWLEQRRTARRGRTALSPRMLNASCRSAAPFTRREQLSEGSGSLNGVHGPNLSVSLPRSSYLSNGGFLALGSEQVVRSGRQRGAGRAVQPFGSRVPCRFIERERSPGSERVRAASPPAGSAASEVSRSRGRGRSRSCRSAREA